MSVILHQNINSNLGYTTLLTPCDLNSDQVGALYSNEKPCNNWPAKPQTTKNTFQKRTLPSLHSNKIRKAPVRLLITSIAQVRYGKPPPDTVDHPRGSYPGSYNSGTALGAATHWRLQEPPRRVGPNKSKHKKPPKTLKNT